MNCSAPVPAERLCGIALCVHITLILCIKACTAAHAHHRTHAHTTMGKLACQWIALDSTGLKSPTKTFNVECLSLWRLISEEPAEEYYPAVAGSLHSQGELECTEERTAAMWRFKSNSSQRISFLWLSRSSKRHSSLCWTEGEKSLPCYTFSSAATSLSAGFEHFQSHYVLALRLGHDTMGIRLARIPLGKLTHLSPALVITGSLYN